MKRYGLKLRSGFLYAQDDAGEWFWFDTNRFSIGRWMDVKILSTSKHLQPDEGISFDTIQEALEYWPDHMWNGWKCSECDWFEEELQAVMKELL